ncbi:MAG: type IV conjugative transfer system protein TraE [Pacificimonas sp.]
MLADIAHSKTQLILKQRNLLALISGALLVLVTGLLVVALTKDREIILQPTVPQPLTISSAGVSEAYLELVTRDVALMFLNRSPDNLDYWMETILKVAHPKAHGKLKRELVAIVTEQQGSNVSQAFTLTGLDIDAKRLRSTVHGELTTFVGSTVIASDARSFIFDWDNTGLSLSLTGLSMISEEG